MVTLRSCFPMLPHCLPAGNSGQQQLPDGSLPQCRHPLRHGTPGQQLRHGAPASNIFPMALRHGAPASSSSVTAPPASSIFPMALRHGAPASNKPHPAEKSTPVWLAIWHTWAGFANSQLRLATLRCIFIYICAHPHCFHLGAAAQTDANLSAHLHRLPTPPPYLRQMRLLPGRVQISDSK